MADLDYGVIGNCRTAALISKEGDLAWLCFPNFDSPSAFASILDREKGGFCGFGKELSLFRSDSHGIFIDVEKKTFIK